MRWNVDAGARRGETRRDAARRGETHQNCRQPQRHRAPSTLPLKGDRRGRLRPRVSALAAPNGRKSRPIPHHEYRSTLRTRRRRPPGQSTSAASVRNSSGWIRGVFGVSPGKPPAAPPSPRIECIQTFEDAESSFARAGRENNLTGRNWTFAGARFRPPRPPRWISHVRIPSSLM